MILMIMSTILMILIFDLLRTLMERKTVILLRKAVMEVAAPRTLLGKSSPKRMKGTGPGDMVREMRVMKMVVMVMVVMVLVMVVMVMIVMVIKIIFIVVIVMVVWVMMVIDVMVTMMMVMIMMGMVRIVMFKKVMEMKMMGIPITKLINTRKEKSPRPQA